uniref:PDZ domain-containing protein n=1 Tax=Setaria digitata TaxID=48799 RepID=A0A915PR67_9BILA
MFNWSLSISSTTLKSVKSLSPSTSSSFSRTFLENIKRSPFYHSFTSLDKAKLWSKFYVDDEENVQKVLDAVSVDQKVITNPHANCRRRTVVVTRNDEEPFGFTLQTYLLKRKGDDVPSKVTYVDYVQLDSPAADAGIRAGDVIISINGHIVTGMSHEELVKLIGSYHQMRMIVIFENIRQHIELVARAIKLRKLLNDKLYQLNLIDIEEQKILNRAYLRSLSKREIRHSLKNSLSSVGTSSNSSVVSSVPSDIGGILNDAERSIIRIPSIIVATHELGIDISKYSLRNRAQERSGFEKSLITNTGMEFLAVQQIHCYESDFDDVDHISSSSCDTKQTVDSGECCDNSCSTADDDICTDNNKSIITIENINSDDIATDVDYADVSHDIDADKSNDAVPAIFLRKKKRIAASIPVSESVFDSVALNHVIMLDDDVIGNGDDDSNEQIRVLKL